MTGSGQTLGKLRRKSVFRRVSSSAGRHRAAMARRCTATTLSRAGCTRVGDKCLLSFLRARCSKRQCSKRSFYQDRLGTNIGEAEGKGVVFCRPVQHSTACRRRCPELHALSTVGDHCHELGGRRDDERQGCAAVRALTTSTYSGQYALETAETSATRVS